MRITKTVFILILLILLTVTVKTAWSSPFSTVSKDHWVFKDLEYLKSREIISGSEDGSSGGYWDFADRSKAAAALAQTLEVFDASTATGR